jgi:STE24 endopeptidase
LSFFGVIVLIQTFINIPFSYYQTFVIEEKFGFNKMTKKLFFLDTIKSLLLTAIIGGIIVGFIVFLYQTFQSNFWWMTWIFLSSISLFMMMFYTSLIVPIFNKLTLLEE